MRKVPVGKGLLDCLYYCPGAECAKTVYILNDSVCDCINCPTAASWFSPSGGLPSYLPTDRQTYSRYRPYSTDTFSLGCPSLAPKWLMVRSFLD